MTSESCMNNIWSNQGTKLAKKIGGHWTENVLINHKKIVFGVRYHCFKIMKRKVHHSAKKKRKATNPSNA